VRSLEVILLSRAGQEQLAMQRAKEAMDAGIVDHDLVNAYFILAWRAKDYPLARQVLERRMAQWPETRARGLVQMGITYAEQDDPAQAVNYFRQGLAAARPQERLSLLQQVPQAYRAQLRTTPPQTSANSR
jgi:hypothetical protein